MGLCISSAGAELASPRKAAAAATALVLLPTGELREYPRPATAARALEDTVSAGGEGNEEGQWFLCDADGVGFEGPVPAVGGDEELRAGQIYFVLPSAARRRGLRREEVAALAVKASVALAARASSAASATTGRRRRRGGGSAVSPLLFPPPTEEEEVSRNTAPPPSAGKRMRPRRPPHHRRFASDLAAIPECEISV